jgi:cell fate regulator YaaT (PSP1 superfamily)
LTDVIEVRFKGNRKEFFSWRSTDAAPLALHDPVIVEVERGEDLGRVSALGPIAAKKCGASCSGCSLASAQPAPSDPHPLSSSPSPEPLAPSSGPDPLSPVPRPHPLSPSPDGEGERTDETVAPLRRIIRRATSTDTATAERLHGEEPEVRHRVIERVRHHALPMKVSDTEWQWDRKKLTVYFTAEQRVDFRALVRDLASAFHTRIELRQIGARDEAKRLDGVGRCGRQFCCSSWLPELRPVSLSLAKDQHLSLNPSQISGGCGRLLCCLRYEHDFYVQTRRRFPKEGKVLRTTVGAERVLAVDIFRETVTLRTDEGDTRVLSLEKLKAEVADG